MFMAVSGRSGITAFDRLGDRIQTTEKRCPTCGYTDEEGNWTNGTTGNRVVYQHVCPRCGAEREYVIKLG